MTRSLNIPANGNSNTITYLLWWTSYDMQNCIVRRSRGGFCWSVACI